MKQILVISGKGGTGKTTLTAGFASLAEDLVIVDCDVDAPDLHMLLKPEILKRIPSYALKIPVRDESKCTGCGKCKEVCRFNAINKNLKILEFKCEGCSVCAFICSHGAIEMVDRRVGEIYISNTRFGPFVHAKLDIGEEASGKLVTEVKKTGREIAERENRDMILIDGPPGIGCPVIASLSGVDIALIVTEPTLSGIHDLNRVIEAAKHFGINTAICINKFDINEENTRRIEKFCSRNKIPILGRIPYDTNVVGSIIELKTIIEFPSSRAGEEIKKIWGKLRNISI